MLQDWSVYWEHMSDDGRERMIDVAEGGEPVEPLVQELEALTATLSDEGFPIREAWWVDDPGSGVRWIHPDFVSWVREYGDAPLT